MGGVTKSCNWASKKYGYKKAKQLAILAKKTSDKLGFFPSRYSLLESLEKQARNSSRSIKKGSFLGSKKSRVDGGDAEDSNEFLRSEAGEIAGEENDRKTDYGIEKIKTPIVKNEREENPRDTNRESNFNKHSSEDFYYYNDSDDNDDEQNHYHYDDSNNSNNDNHSLAGSDLSSEWSLEQKRKR